jgi:hypothetical protein
VGGLLRSSARAKAAHEGEIMTEHANVTVEQLERRVFLGEVWADLLAARWRHDRTRRDDRNGNPLVVGGGGFEPP